MTAAEDAKKKAEAEAKKIVDDAKAEAKKLVDEAKKEAESIIDDANEEADKVKADAEDGEKEDGEDRSYNDRFNDLYAAVSRQLPDSVDKDLTLRSIAGLQAETRTIHGG
ncbi:hypothetical protein Fullmetal_51 [Microbacterium phage Fullmetal]|uniref:Uncharacterized protein n=5 Tax=Akonivirus phedro TaxID=2845594 RepID=A0A6M3T3R5_9CAUD|nr:hypothetical protein HWD33_gp51 [Microbacterium phage Phedro]QFG04974.1 hypothetical protein SEA_PHRIEDRICE_52 [Microbacterium phage PhriedRice]QJD52903.1 hypothetical protein SEA_PHRACTURED_51 [Microbacterium phage Phractured]QJD53013.1 hypothetical protein SEA_PHARKY_51 [Microbacterium phage Pharky]QWY82743.1 hypothetical protein SEA_STAGEPHRIGHT_51 [Microbacterium phage StagePhright]UXE04140.1 hypothetical protein Fullmetal_51 [Microbacterium phage Fullmetal]